LYTDNDNLIALFDVSRQVMDGESIIFKSFPIAVRDVYWFGLISISNFFEHDQATDHKKLNTTPMKDDLIQKKGMGCFLKASKPVFLF
jgi:hypothetical protein